MSALPSIAHAEFQRCITTRGVSWLQSVSRPHLKCPVPYARTNRKRRSDESLRFRRLWAQCSIAWPICFFFIRLSSVWSFLSTCLSSSHPRRRSPSEVQHTLAASIYQTPLPLLLLTEKTSQLLEPSIFAKLSRPLSSCQGSSWATSSLTATLNSHTHFPSVFQKIQRLGRPQGFTRAQHFPNSAKPAIV